MKIKIRTSGPDHHYFIIKPVLQIEKLIHWWNLSHKGIECNFPSLYFCSRSSEMSVMNIMFWRMAFKLLTQDKCLSFNEILLCQHYVLQTSCRENTSSLTTKNPVSFKLFFLITDLHENLIKK